MIIGVQCVDLACEDDYLKIWSVHEAEPLPQPGVEPSSLALLIKYSRRAPPN